MAKKAPLPAATTSGLSLGQVGDLSSLLDGGPAQATGTPVLLPLSVIDEDPEQPRKAFNADTLKELAASITARGVKTPISVRPHPQDAGRYIINHGARRYRASALAGIATIPCYVDHDYTRADQVIENLHRDELSPREIADYIGRELSEGKSKSEIAALLNKSNAFVSQHVTLLDLPDVVAEVFASGRAVDVTIINELVRLHKKNADAVRDWLANDDQEITRGTVRVLKEFIDAKTRKADAPTPPAAPSPEAGQEPAAQEAAAPDPEQVPMFPADPPDDPEKPASKGEAPTATMPLAPAPKERDADVDHDPEKFRKAIVFVRHDERPARLVLTRRPSAPGLGWIKYEDDGAEVEAALDLVIITHLVEG